MNRDFEQKFWNLFLESVGFFGGLLILVGVCIAQTPDASPTIGSSSDYRLGAGDVIRITVLKQDILTQDGIRISNEGTIRLPMIDEPIRSSCLTEAELSASIAEKYKKYILNPQVYVSVKEYNSKGVAVIGAVNAPGRFQLQRPVRLLEILTYVNGPSPAAGRELQILRMAGPDQCTGGKLRMEVVPEEEAPPEIVTLKIADVMGGSENFNPTLRAGDIVRVIEAEVRQAFVVGSVRAATAVNLKDPVTLSTAIAMAGGTVGGAQLEKIKITRQNSDGTTKSDLYFNLKEIRKGSVEDVLLQPNDVVEVPGPSGTKKFFKDILRTIVPVFTRAPVIIP